MPELPEVEVARLSFAEQIAGARIVAVRMGKPLRWPLGAPPEALVNRRVQGVRRRGKYLLLDLDAGMLMIHLGMSGSLRFAVELPPAGVHDHFELHTSHGILRLHDPRRFGAVLLVQGEDDPRAAKLLDGLGLEPLEDAFSAEAFGERLKRRHAAIKQVLLGGKVVVGVGNIYASEALFAARIHPATLASRLTRAQVERLWLAVRAVIAQAITHGGSTLRDYSNALGDNGHFQLHAEVYGKKGEPCSVCGRPIQMRRQGQRATYFCAYCQRRR